MQSRDCIYVRLAILNFLTVILFPFFDDDMILWWAGLMTFQTTWISQSSWQCLKNAGKLVHHKMITKICNKTCIKPLRNREDFDYQYILLIADKEVVHNRHEILCFILYSYWLVDIQPTTAQLLVIIFLVIWDLRFYSSDYDNYCLLRCGTILE